MIANAMEVDQLHVGNVHGSSRVGQSSYAGFSYFIVFMIFFFFFFFM